ncbi:inositol polyphosphate kinase family protein [Streptomyces tagetis]|uniref:Inositol polyphosphate kinase family protein n=1 Tax=Streptomyces tagetis TaxID=2820809 RepID=A0A941AYI5_9ACTN|nr:inositol polyphosphate kinase family protein [Streptomyces sp. RG38]MBQ0827499.1 inositol polyphosphate kinase family protein [Streptomyces sp. RG38]
MATPAEPTYREEAFPSIDEAEAAAVGEGRRSASPEPDVNQGGHGGIRALGDARRILEKPAPYDSVENEFYRRVRAGEYPEFTPVVPASYTADQVRGMLGGELSAAESAGLDDGNCVYLQNITSDLDQAKTLDTKIGRSTTSYRENRAQQDKSAWDAGLKSFKFVFGADLVTGSTLRGWRVVAGTDAGGNRLLDGMQSQQILSRFSDDPAVWDRMIGKMKEIRTAADSSELGFVAASVFSVHGTRNGETRVDAKLIDFAHVIDARNPFKSPPPSAESSPRLGGAPAARDLTSAGNKYRDRFVSGMDALIADATRIRATKAARAAMAPASGQTQSSAAAPAAVAQTAKNVKSTGPRR